RSWGGRWRGCTGVTRSLTLRRRLRPRMRQRDNGLVVAGAVPLTSALLQDITAGKLASPEVADVVPYLRRHLHWRVGLWTGEAHPVAEVSGLKASVCSSGVRIGEGGIPGSSREY